VLILPPADRPSTLSFQPVPRETQVARLRLGTVEVTAITRHWDPAEIDRCRLCPRCAASPHSASCLVLTTAPVPVGSAPLFPHGGT
jgi:hypothetical protein